jgi:diaminopimelate epimerase
MRVLNADGSEAEMCGNGIRCVSKWLHERDPSLRRASLPIETGAGLLHCGVTLDGSGRVTHVSVEMGRPRLAPSEIPLAGGAVEGPPGGPVIRRPLAVAGRALAFTAVSMGNPHAVFFLDGDEDPAAFAASLGPTIEVLPAFPRKTNVEFARMRARTAIDLVVWERGAGLTLACGTGACATAVAAVLEGRAPAASEIAVALPGGTLGITVAEGLAGVTMRGPADEVYEAELELAPLVARARARARGGRT